MARRFARYPGAVARTVELADELAFDLRQATPRLPKQQVPDGPHADELAARAVLARAPTSATPAAAARQARSGSSTSCE